MNKEDYPDSGLPPPPALPPPSLGKILGGGVAPDLGPLPSNWEMAYTEDGTPYFIE